MDSNVSFNTKESNSNQQEKQSANINMSQTNEINPYYKDVTYKLENYFGTKVNITNKNNKGKIEIEYYSQAELERLIDLFESIKES